MKRNMAFVLIFLSVALLMFSKKSVAACAEGNVAQAMSDVASLIPVYSQICQNMNTSLNGPAFVTVTSSIYSSTYFYHYYCGTDPEHPPGGFGFNYCIEKGEEYEKPELARRPARQCGSIIEIDNQVLGERVPIVGTEFFLSYQADRDPARTAENSVKIPLPYTIADSGTTSWKLHFTYDGITDVYNFAHLSGIYHSFTWDGRDRSNMPVQSMEFEVRWEQVPDPNWPFDVTKKTFKLGSFDAQTYGLGGWMISEHHYYLKDLETLYYGNGPTVTSPAEQLSNGNLKVYDRSAGLYYIFDPEGKHLETRTFLTGALRYTFSYDFQGRLSEVEDYNGNIVVVLRDGSGNLVGIESSEGLVTALSLNGHGKLASITNPQSETVALTYYNSGSGLLQTYQKPEGQISTFTYDGEGFLVEDSHQAGPSTTLVKTQVGGERTIEATSAEGRVNTYVTSFQGSSNIFTYYRSLVSHSGLRSNWSESDNFESYSTPTFGETSTYGDDIRFGKGVRYPNQTSVVRGTIGTYVNSEEIFVNLDSNDPHLFDSFQETLLVNMTDTYTRSFDYLTKTW